MKLLSLSAAFHCISASLQLNVRYGGVLLPSTFTVNADSTLSIYSLTSSIYSTYNAGDCFQIELEYVDSYQSSYPGVYEPFPYTTLVDCSFTPAATCTRVSGQIVQIKLTESGNDLVGTIGKMKNPFSVVSIGVNRIRYYDGCSSSTQADTSGRVADITFAPGAIANAAVTNSKNIVGARDATSVAKFTFTPGTSLPTSGGQIVFTMPVWYGATTNLMYSFEESGFTCSCDRITSGLLQQSVPRWNLDLGALTKEYVIEYSTISGDATAAIEFQCSYYRNPIVPVDTTGFQIVTKDLDSNLVDVSNQFTLEASSYSPYPLTADAVSYTISGSTIVQQETSLTVSFESGVPFEYTGCYVKYTFPKELTIVSSDLTKYTGGSLLVTSSGGTTLTPESTDLVSTDKYVILKGCLYNADKTFIEYTMQMKFQNIYLPYAKRTTSPFKIQVYKSYDSATKVLSQEILSSTLSSISETLFQTNSLSSMSLTASNYAVQETGIHYFKFTTASAIPSTSGTGIETGIHILFPTTFTQDPDNSGETGKVTISDITGTIFSYIDTTSDYDENCFVYLCYRIEFSTSSQLSGSRSMTVAISNLLNPESVLKTGDMTISTMMRYTGDTVYYKIDTLTAASNFQATMGTISSMSVTNVFGDFTTYADNQVYDLKYTSKHKVYVGGYVKVFLPSEFTMSSESGATANFRILDASSKSYASIYKVSASSKYIIGQANIEMPANTIFTIRIGGLRNPRFLIDNSQLKVKQQFTIKTYDSSSVSFIDSQNIIDKGEGAPVDITIASKFSSFSIEAYNLTNGADSTYLITWFSEIEIKDDDELEIVFPIESVLITKDWPYTANRALICEGINGVTRAKCERDKKNERLLHIRLVKVTQATGQFKVSVDLVRNPPSLRGSSPIESITIVNRDEKTIAQYDGSIVIENYYASNLQNIKSSNIIQSNTNYGEESIYTISFTPQSQMTNKDSEPLTILLQYPSTISPFFEEQGCEVITYTKKGAIRSSSRYCYKMPNSRIFRIEKAIDYEYDALVQIKIELKNPKNNIPGNGFKIKTYEVYYDSDGEPIEYLVDQLETNELLPNLRCDFPCQDCMDSDIVQNRTFCTKCWQNPSNQYKYLMEYEPYSRATFGSSTCETNCPDGYTSNGDTEFHRCVKCDESCATCQDNDLEGDKFRCNICSRSNPYMYAPESQCMEKCDVGFYQVTDSTCDKCLYPCRDCVGDKYNCTSCDLNGTNPAIFVSTLESNGTNVTRQSCRAACPMGYFMDFSDPEYIFCNFCNEPCGTCEDIADKCLSCDGSENRYYLYNETCYVDCPDYTAPDLSNLICVNCSENCLQCGTMEGPSCYKCAKPYLLEDAVCVKECTKEGFKPNNDLTACINEITFPIIGPVFTAMAIVSTFTVFLAKCINRATEVIPSIIAFVSLQQFFVIGFQIYLCYHFQIRKYFIISCIAGGCLIIINIFNMGYIHFKVRSSNASKKVKLSQAKVQKIYLQKLKKDKRKVKYQIDKEFLEGGEIELDPVTLQEQQIFKQGKSYYKYSNIEDRGFNKWEGAYDKTAQFISIVALVFSFKFYRLTYSNFLGRKQFLVLYQKKKYKKIIVIETLVSMFFVELVMIIGDFVGAVGLDYNQLYYTMCDSFAICIYLLVLEFIEIARLDQIMRTMNSISRQAKKSAAANDSTESSSDNKDDATGSPKKKKKKSIKKITEDDYPDWKLMFKKIHGNENLFDKTPLQLKLTDLEKRFDKRNAESCYDFKTGTEIEEDPRRVSSFPSSPIGYDNFDGFDFRVFPKTDDNCYAEAKPRPVTPPPIIPPVMVDTGVQAKPNDILTALARKGGDLLTPDIDEKDHRRFSAKKTRGRKNQYYQQIDIEDITRGQPQEPSTERIEVINEEQDESEEERIRQEIEAEDMRMNEERERVEMGKEEENKRQVDQYEKEKSEEAMRKQLEELEEKKRQEEQERKRREEEKMREDEEKRKLEEEKRKLEEEEKRRKEEEDRRKKEEDDQRQKEEESRLEEQRLKDDEEALALLEEQRQQELQDLILKQEEEAYKNNQDTLDAENLETQILNETRSLRPHSPEASNHNRYENSSSNLSNMMVKSNAIISFKGKVDDQIIEVPPTVESRRFNENDILGNLDRDEKGNVIPEKDINGYRDQDGNETNQRGYLTNKSGDIVNNFNSQKMFPKTDLDERGELPAPFNIEKYNFNPHKIRGNFDYDRNGLPKIIKNKYGDHVDRNGAIVTSRGYKIDQNGNIIDYDRRKKFDKSHLSGGDLPKLYNYNGKRFDIKDIMGRVNVDRKGNIQHQMDKHGNIIDNFGRPINSKGYLIDEFGNVIDNEAKIIFEKKHLLEDEIPKIFPFTRFNIKSVQGDYEMDPLGNPILENLGDGKYRDRKGQRVNAKGYLIDTNGNVINKNGKMQFFKDVLDNEGDIPKVFRTGLLKSSTGSSISRLMSEIGHQQRSSQDFDDLEKRFNEAQQNYQTIKRGKSGQTSLDSLMEDTPANYNKLNQGYVDDTIQSPRNMDLEMLQADLDLDQQYEEFNSQYGSVPVIPNSSSGFELLQTRKKKKKMNKVTSKWEDPNIREVLLAGAYGGVAKKKVKRNGIISTHDIYQGLQDIPVPTGTNLLARRVPSNFGGSRNSNQYRRDSSRLQIRDQLRRIDSGSEFGSHYGSQKKLPNKTAFQSNAIRAAGASLLDPQQKARATQVVEHKSRDIQVKKNNLMNKTKQRQSKDKDFEHLFGQDIDEFLDNSEWDVASAGKLSNLSKSTVKSAKLRGLENIYLRRIDSSKLNPPKVKSRLKKFRETGERFLTGNNSTSKMI